MSAADTARPAWRLPAGLLLLSAIPLLGGAIRLVTLATGVEITAENARFFASPIPVVLHIVSATLFLVLGAFQFAPAIRRNRPGWHRRAGRVLVASSLIAALSALWMTLFYPPPPTDGELLFVFRLAFGSAMAGSIVIGLLAIRRREIARHRAWMMRGYAIGMGAGTQVLTLTLGALLLGTPGEDARALLMGGAWAINLAVAEWAIRGRPLWRRPSRPRRLPQPAPLDATTSASGWSAGRPS